MKYLTSLLFVISVFGCASNNKPQELHIDMQEKILIISQLDDNFPVKSVGFTVFQNEKFDIDSHDWEVNDYVESYVSARLSSNYTVTSDKSIRSRLQTPKVDFLSGKLNPIKDLSVLSQAKALNVKYILVVSPIEYTDAYYGTNQKFRGNGIYQRGDNSIQYAQINFSLFSAPNGDFILSNGSIGHNDGDSTWITNQYFGYPIFNNVNDISPKNMRRIKSNNEYLISRLTERSLKFMGFKLSNHN